MKKLWIAGLVLAAATAIFAQTKGALPGEKAPAQFNAKFETSAGVFVIEAHRDWAPFGADRFHNLVKSGFYDNARFYRVRPGFMAQFGFHADPNAGRRWITATIPDDPVKQGNTRGFVSFAKTAAPNSRTTQIFINYANNSFLNRDGFAPFGKVVTGMDVVDKLYGVYGENSNQQDRIRAEGNAFLTKNFPKLDYIKKATIEK